MKKITMNREIMYPEKKKDMEYILIIMVLLLKMKKEIKRGNFSLKNIIPLVDIISLENF